MKIRRWLALFACLTLLCPCALAEVQYAVASDVRYTADWDALHAIVPNAAGWLFQPDAPIDQPILWNNDRYRALHFDYRGVWSNNGTLYMTGEEMPDLTAPLITIHGANCLDNTLLGSLSEYKHQEYYDSHPFFYLITPEGNYRLDVFAGVRTRHSDHDSWVVTEESIRQPETLAALMEKSLFTADPAAMPLADDDWAVLATESSDGSGNRYVIYTRKRAIADAAARTVQLNKREMDSRQTMNGYVYCEAGTWMVYGQNDPIWDRLIFEVPYSSRHRNFGDGGCGPTAVAMAIANLVPKEELGKIAEYATDPEGYTFCSCCIGTAHCNEGHVPYQMKTPDEYLRYFPLAVADFAMGNNVFGVQGRRDSYGTNMTYLESLCSVYGITMTSVRSRDDAIAMLQKGNATAIACTTSGPFTSRSHFITLAGADEEYLYILDPLRREDYTELDRYEALELITPGLVRVKLENAHLCRLSSIAVMTRE